MKLKNPLLLTALILGPAVFAGAKSFPPSYGAAMELCSRVAARSDRMGNECRGYVSEKSFTQADLDACSAVLHRGTGQDALDCLSFRGTFDWSSAKQSPSKPKNYAAAFKFCEAVQARSDAEGDRCFAIIGIKNLSFSTLDDCRQILKYKTAKDATDCIGS